MVLVIGSTLAAFSTPFVKGLQLISFKPIINKLANDILSISKNNYPDFVSLLSSDVVTHAPIHTHFMQFHEYIIAVTKHVLSKT